MKQELRKIDEDVEVQREALSKLCKPCKLRIFIIPDVEHVTNPEKQKLIFRREHESPTGGHMGIEKLYRTLKLSYFWTNINMREMIKQYVKNSDSCQRFKHATQQKIPMSITDTAKRAFDKIFVDIVGPLQEARNGNRYVITIQDDLTKLQEAIAIPNKYAETIAENFVENFFLKYGFPMTIASDCGCEFDNELLTNL